MAAVTCLTDGGGTPAKNYWYQEAYSATSGKIWIEYDAVNRCPGPVQGWEFSVTFVDAFGDTVFSGTGKVWLKKPVAPGKRFRANKTGAYGVFNLSGSEWKDFMDFHRQFDSSSRGEAYWSYTVLETR